VIVDDLYDHLNITIRKYNSGYKQQNPPENIIDTKTRLLNNSKDNQPHVSKELSRETFNSIKNSISKAYSLYVHEETIRNKKPDQISTELHIADNRITLITEKLTTLERFGEVVNASNDSRNCCSIL